jgi:hypothetical protein
MPKLDWRQRRSLAAILPPQDQMILEAFQSDVYVQGKVDVQNEPLYDTFNLAIAQVPTENNTALFTAVGPASGKTLGSTNLTQPRRLPAPEAFSVLGIRLYWNEDILIADLLQIVGNAVTTPYAFQFFLGQKCYNRGPIWYYAAGGGFYNTNANAAALGLFTNGIPDRNSMHKLAIPLVIENQGEFYANLTGGPAAALTGTFSLMCLLDGLHARGVQ